MRDDLWTLQAGNYGTPILRFESGFGAEMAAGCETFRIKMGIVLWDIPLFSLRPYSVALVSGALPQ